jgi:hypothetical protein
MQKEKLLLKDVELLAHVPSSLVELASLALLVSPEVHLAQ